MNKRAPKGGLTEYGHTYRGGEFLPFYVPREDMPQIPMEAYPLLVRDAFPIGIHFGVTDTHQLRAHQRVDHTLALKVAADPHELLIPVIVSADGYVLDGNHRWWAHVHGDMPAIATINIHLPFDAAIDWLMSLPYTQRTIPPEPAEPH